jgi:hypothetical protein
VIQTVCKALKHSLSLLSYSQENTVTDISTSISLSNAMSKSIPLSKGIYTFVIGLLRICLIVIKSMVTSYTIAIHSVVQ